MTWISPSPGAKYGGSLAAQGQAATKDATATATIAVVPTASLAGITSPSEPMFWFAVLAAGTFGLMAYSTVDRA